MSQQIMVRPLGLITQPNKLGTFPEGALKEATGIFIRDPNIAEQAQQTSVPFGTVPNLNAAIGPIYMFPGPPGVPTVGETQLLLLWESTAGSAWRYSWLNGTTNNGANNLQSQEAVNQLLSTSARVSCFVQRARQFINPVLGVLAFDHVATNPTPRLAGLPPVVISNAFAGGSGGFIPAGTYVHYTAIVRRVFSDGYEVISAPAACYWFDSSSGDSQINVRMSDDYHKVGDIVDIYRTRCQPNNTNTGADYYLCASVTFTSAHIAAGFVNVPDNTNDALLGEALYTNPGQGGSAAAALPPPTCKVMATFKGHAFYLNCTDPPKQILRMGVFVGFMGTGAAGANAYARKNGIGSRTVTGTLASGSPTMTGISAADMVGIQVNQAISDSQFTPGQGVVVSFTGSSITFSVNANTTGGAKQVIVNDVIEIDGQSGTVSTANSFGILPVLTASTITQYAVLSLDRLLPQDYGAGVTNPETVFAEGLTVTRLWLANGHSANLTFRATNGQNYVPPIPALATGVSALSVPPTLRPNGVSWSEQNEPENVPAPNVLPVGNGVIYAAFSTRDALWIFASDGLWRLSGTGGSVAEGYDWRVDPVDSTLSLSGPQAGCVLRDTVYAYTNRGFVAIDSSGNIRELSVGRINDIMPGPPWSEPTWTYTVAMWAVANETHDEIHFTINNGSDRNVYVYNVLNDVFTRIRVQTAVANDIPGHAAYIRTSEEVVYAQAGTNSVIGRSNGLFGSHLLQLQPVYGDNPFVMHHWQVANFVFADASTAQSIIATINGSDVATVTPTLMTDSGFQRVSISVPRNAPAIANQISPGFRGNGGNNTARKLFGIALDYVDLTDQRRKR